MKINAFIFPGKREVSGEVLGEGLGHLGDGLGSWLEVLLEFCGWN